MNEWQQTGDFNKKYNSRASINGYETYSINQKEFNLELKILGYRDGDIILCFQSKNNGEFNIKHVKENEITKKVVFEAKKQGLILRRGLGSDNSIKFESKNKEECKKFILIIESVAAVPIPLHMKKRILNILSIQVIEDEAALFDSLKKLIDENLIENVFEQIKQHKGFDKYPKLLLNLGKYCESINNIDYAFDCYNLLEDTSEKNYTILANQKKYNLLQMLLTSVDKQKMKNESQEEQERYASYCELEVECLLKMPDKDQRLIDRLYQSLCGSSFNNDIKDISINAETIINLARIQKQQREENKELREENKNLKQKINLLKLKNQESFSSNAHGIFVRKKDTQEQNPSSKVRHYRSFSQ